MHIELLLIVCVLFQIVHLKRFQFVNGRWIKSQKIVKFPRESFDPSAFLAPREVSHSMGTFGSLQSLQSQSECLVEELQRLERGESSVSTISTTTVASPPTSGRGTSLSLSLSTLYEHYTRASCCFSYTVLHQKGGQPLE